jgi:TPR repeat protein
VSRSAHPFRRRASHAAADGPSRPVRRERPLALALRLYRQDPTFRGFVEFCVIATVVLSFIQPIGFGNPLNALFGLVGSGDSAMMAPNATKGSELVGRPQSLGDLLAAAHKRLYSARPRRPYSAPLDRTLFNSSRPEVRAHLHSAADAYARGQPLQALAELRNAADDDPNVIMFRGIATLAIPGSNNAAAGVALLKKAAELGQRQAKSFLGLLLLNGPPGTIKHDPEAGRRYLEQAAEEGDRDAALMIGAAYHFGWSGIVDQKRAVKYLRMAANANDREAAFTLAYLASQGIGMERDPAEAERLVQQAADAGHFLAQPLLGMYYLSQYVSGWIADPAPALRWLGRAAEQGHPEATMLLGSFYTNPPVDPALQDLEKGAAYFRKCAIRLFPPCLFAYGKALENGAGTPRDLVGAYAHYRLALEKGVTEARKPIANLDRALTDEQKREARKITDTMTRDWPWSPFALRGNVEPLSAVPGFKETLERRRSPASR